MLDEIIKKLNGLSENTELLEQLKQADAENALRILAEHGIEIKKEDIPGLIKSYENPIGELDVESLDEVSGGGFWRDVRDFWRGYFTAIGEELFK